MRLANLRLDERLPFESALDAVCSPVQRRAHLQILVGFRVLINLYIGIGLGQQILLQEFVDAARRLGCDVGTLAFADGPVAVLGCGLFGGNGGFPGSNGSIPLATVPSAARSRRDRVAQAPLARRATPAGPRSMSPQCPSPASAPPSQSPRSAPCSGAQPSLLRRHQDWRTALTGRPSSQARRSPAKALTEG